MGSGSRAQLSTCGTWTWLPRSEEGDLPRPFVELTSPTLARRSFTTEPPGNPGMTLDNTSSLIHKLCIYRIDICEIY